MPNQCRRSERIMARLKLKKNWQILIAAAMLMAFLATSVSAWQSSWAPNTTYATGAQATYNGATYKCIQGHTSIVGWEPPNVPALWSPASGGGTPPPPPTPTPTPTPGPPPP